MALIFPPLLESSPTTFAIAVIACPETFGAVNVTVGVVKYPDPAVDIVPSAQEGTTFDTTPVTVPTAKNVLDPTDLPELVWAESCASPLDKTKVPLANIPLERAAVLIVIVETFPEVFPFTKV